MLKKSLLAASTLAVTSLGVLLIPNVSPASGFGDFMNPSKWFGGRDRDYYDRDYYRGYGYGGPWGGYGGYPGYGGWGPGYGWGGPGYGWGGPGYGWGGYPGYGYGYGAPANQQQAAPPEKPQ